MKEIIQRLVKDVGFEQMKDNIMDMDNSDIELYINRINDELYMFDYSSGLDIHYILHVLDRIMYRNDNLNKANKANTVYISVVECDLFDENIRNAIMQIEENNLYCQKLVLHYTEEEDKYLASALKENSVKKYLDKMVMSSELFQNYKVFAKEKKILVEDKEKTSEDKEISDKETKIKNNAKLYSIISKLYIKLPFMTLVEVGKFNKSITDYIMKNLNQVNAKLYSELNVLEDEINEEFLERVLKLVKLGTNDKNDINKELEKVGAYIEE